MAAPSLFFSIFLKILLMASTCLLDCRCAGEVKKMLMLNQEHRCRKREESNCLSLSVTIACGRLKQQIMFFHMKCFILVVVIVARASALTHLVKYSTATTVNYTCPLPCGIGPMRSSPHCENGLGLMIGESGSTGRFDTEPKCWNWSHRWTSLKASMWRITQ